MLDAIAHGETMLYLASLQINAVVAVQKRQMKSPVTLIPVRRGDVPQGCRFIFSWDKNVQFGGGK